MTDETNTNAPEIDVNDERVQKLIDKEVEGLKNKNQELILANKRLKEAATTTDNVDVEEYEQLKREKAEREEAEAKKRGEFEKLMAQKTEKHEAEVKRLKDELSASRQRIERMTIMNEVTASIAAEKANARLLTPQILDRVRYDESTGEVVVLGKDGEPMLGEKGEAATLKDLHEEFKRDADLQSCYPATAIPGTGSRPNVGKGGVRNPFTKEHYNLTEQMKLQRENPALAAQMEAAAG